MIHLQDLLDLIKIYAMHKHKSSEKKDQVYSKRTCPTLTLESTSETQKPSHHIDFNPNR